MWDIPITILRDLLGDYDEALYTDAKLQRILAISAFNLVGSVSFSTSYTVDLTAAAENVTPDPTDPMDYDFINLMCLKASISVVGAEIKLSSGNAVTIKDGPASITLGNTSNILKTRLTELKTQYEDYVKAYLCGKSKFAGCVLGPTTTFHADYTIYSDREIG